VKIVTVKAGGQKEVEWLWCKRVVSQQKYTLYDIWP